MTRNGEAILAASDASYTVATGRWAGAATFTTGQRATGGGEAFNNNQAEVQAALLALDAAPPGAPLTLLSDSVAVIQAHAWGTGEITTSQVWRRFSEAVRQRDGLPLVVRRPVSPEELVLHKAAHNLAYATRIAQAAGDPVEAVAVQGWLSQDLSSELLSVVLGEQGMELRLADTGCCAVRRSFEIELGHLVSTVDLHRCITAPGTALLEALPHHEHVLLSAVRKLSRNLARPENAVAPHDTAASA